MPIPECERTRTIRIDTRRSAELRSSRDVHLYVIDEDDEGEAVLVFPLSGHESSNHLAAGNTHLLPGARTGERDYWQVTSVGGQEHLLVVAAPGPLADLELEAAGMTRPEAGRPLTHARLSEPTKIRLRGIAGFVTKPVPRTGRARNRLFEGAEPLDSAPERVQGVWVRRLDLENP